MENPAALPVATPALRKRVSIQKVHSEQTDFFNKYQETEMSHPSIGKRSKAMLLSLGEKSSPADKPLPFPEKGR